ncbi:hypothetical protein HHL25_16075 [Rhizobium sp. S-51]|uniref:Nucleoside 2-deoxyribosyltransferase n=1 Tax=Rhizobium terricola TaxID=2728849 RepID=A0A7Y0AY48_9HYPH|nr:hypothetical protein [Rhizobium terricola]NML75649.1 hypothetical protein [Rhizobium terricola]
MRSIACVKKSVVEDSQSQPFDRLSKMQFDRIKKLAMVARADEIRRAAERYEIFVAGPFIDINLDKDDPVNASTDAKRLRFHVHQYYRAAGHNLYLGEDVELRTIGEKHYGAAANATFYERHYIADNIDALIVFPAGPGVFCEFGDWATSQHFCRKMLVVIDKEYEGQPSYINDGTAKAAAYNGATIVYEKYSDQAAVLVECDRFIDRLATRARVDQLYGR